MPRAVRQKMQAEVNVRLPAACAGPMCFVVRSSLSAKELNEITPVLPMPDFDWHGDARLTFNAGNSRSVGSAVLAPAPRLAVLTITPNAI